MKVSIPHQNVFDGKFYAVSQDEDYPHIYGVGTTADEALTSFKIRLNQARKEKSCTS